MAVLTVVKSGEVTKNFDQIKSFLLSKGVWHDQWVASKELSDNSTQEEILNAYSESLAPFMAKGGYKTADVINVHPNTPDLLKVREKFLREHTHSEDEIRFFVDGTGLFWFNVNDEVFSLLCEKGDLISVPARTRHWFDLGPNAFVKAIRIFTDAAGWVPNYTNSGIDEKYNPKY
jgi:1,2-dihydroxy-3-keto-5-methylthiopentene dioxygenase